MQYEPVDCRSDDEADATSAMAMGMRAMRMVFAANPFHARRAEQLLVIAGCAVALLHLSVAAVHFGCRMLRRNC
jgi:hypothetical protein